MYENEAKSKQKAKGYFVVSNDRGLHTRPSTEIVKCAALFKSDIYLVVEGHRANAKSLLGILMMAASKGTRIKVEAEGVDADKAVSCLLTLANNNFNISY